MDFFLFQDMNTFPRRAYKPEGHELLTGGLMMWEPAPLTIC